MAEGNIVGSGGGVPGNAAFTASWCFSTAVLGGVILFPESSRLRGGVLVPWV